VDFGGGVLIYFDTCIHDRNYDDQRDQAIVDDIADIALIIKLCKFNGHPILGSRMVVLEHNGITDEDLRENLNKQYEETIDANVIINADIDERAQVLQAENVGYADSYHLAAAEAAGATVLLTVDKKFIRVVERKNLSNVLVISPLNFLRKVYLWKK